MFSFGGAIELLKSGKKVARFGWNGANQFLCLQTPDENSKMRKPYIFISPVDGELVPWLASQTDMLANDWIEVFNVPEDKAKEIGEAPESTGNAPEVPETSAE